MLIAKYTANASGVVPTFNDGYVYEVTETENEGIYTVEINSDNEFISCNFLGKSNLLTVEYLKITSNVTSMASMFNGCTALTSLDVSGFDTTNVTTMANMFAGCKALTSLDVSGFDTTNVTSMTYMFNNCNALTSLDLSNFNTSNVTSMTNMLRYCNALMTLNVTGWPNNDYTQTAISSLPVGNDATNEIYATVSFTVPSGWSLINNESMTMSLRQTDLDNLTDEEIAALVDEGWTIG